jgi:hypothetical protein
MGRKADGTAGAMLRYRLGATDVVRRVRNGSVEPLACWRECMAIDQRETNLRLGPVKTVRATSRDPR